MSIHPERAEMLRQLAERDQTDTFARELQYRMQAEFHAAWVEYDRMIRERNARAARRLRELESEGK